LIPLQFWTLESSHHIFAIDTRHPVQFVAFPFRHHLEQAVAAMSGVLSLLHAAVPQHTAAVAAAEVLLSVLVVHLCVRCARYLVLPNSNSLPPESCCQQEVDHENWQVYVGWDGD